MKKLYLVRTILLAGSLLLQLNTFCLHSRGAPGDVDLSFDPGFGIDGTTNWEYPYTVVNALAVQPDGKIIIGGHFTTVKGLVRTNIARLNADGSGDSSFVSPPMNYPVSSLALQSDGKVLVGSLGSLNDGPKVGLIRLNSNGSPDTNFNANAYAAIGLAAINTIIVQPDGMLICSGGTPVRLNNNGTRDSNFVSGAVANVISMALQPDGKLLVGGDSIVRLNANGSIDNTFNSIPDGWAFPIVLQPDGKVLAGGGHVRRFNTNGSLDQTFEVSYVAYVELVHTLALQPDGKVIIGGHFVSVNGHSRTNLARLNADGSVDLSFQNGTGGVSGEGALYFVTYVRAIALQTNGTMLIGGAFTTVNGTNRNRMARLHSDGSLDAAFHPGQGLESFYSSLVVQPDGKVLVGGPLTFINGTNRYAYARLNANGSRDETFVAATNFNPNLLAVRRYDDCLGGNYNCQLLAWASTVAVQADGKVLVGGGVRAEVTGEETWLFFYRAILGRFYADGSLDTIFAPVFGNPGGNDYDHFQGVGKVIVQPDGKIMVGGYFSSVNGTNRNGLARLNTNGTLDLSFAPATGASAWISSVAVQPDGKVLIAGSLGWVNGTFPRGIARLNVNGSFDSSFNSTITLTNGDPFYLPVHSLALQSDGKVLIGGSFTNVNGTNLTSIARLNVNGSLDGTFNPGTTGDHALISSIALQSDGKVLIGGDFLTVNGAVRPHVARLYGDSAPSLNIARSNGFVIVSWPVTGLNVQLQESTNLSLPNGWSPAAQPAITNAGQISVTVPATVGRDFFRLTSP